MAVNDRNSQPLTYESIVDRLRYSKEHFSGRDKQNRALGAFATAALVALDTQPFFAESVLHMIECRPELTPAHALKLTERSVQDVVSDLDPHYPHGYRDPTRWLRALEMIEQSPQHAERLFVHMLFHDVQSNIPERYKTLKMLNVAYGDRFEGAPSILDVGSSVMHGDLMLAFEGSPVAPRLRFKDVAMTKTVEGPELRDIQDGIRETEPARAQTDLANIALQQTVKFGHMRGLDLTNIHDKGIQSWVRNSFYPDELLDPKIHQEYDLLESLDPDNTRVQFSQLDIASRDDVQELRKTTDDQRYDIIVFFTVLYQTKSYKIRHDMVVNAAQMLSERGIIVIQDEPDGNFEKPYAYTTLVNDPEHPSMQAQEIMRWRTARCAEGMFSSGTLHINGENITFEEALRRQLY